LRTDTLIRRYFDKSFPDVSDLKTEYSNNDISIYIYIPEVNVILGENNQKLDTIRRDVSKIVDDEDIPLNINLIEVKNVYTRAKSLANLISSQLSKRARYRMVLRNITTRLISEREIKGFKIKLAGRLDQSEIAQTKKES
jgi:ribosomal protein S3